MGIKEDIESIKTEIVGESRMLEYFIHSEKFFKKYKMVIISGVVATVLTVSAVKTMSYLDEQNLLAANESYIAVLSDPTNTQALSDLKDKNPNLHKLYLFQQASKANDVTALAAMSNNGDITGKLASYQLYSINNDTARLSSNAMEENGVLKDLSALEAAYLHFKAGNIEKAQLDLAKVPFDSQFKRNADAMAHYGIAKN